MRDKPVDVTVEYLQTQIERAANCSEATVPGDALRVILDLALRAKMAEPKVKKRPRFRIVPKG